VPGAAPLTGVDPGLIDTVPGQQAFPGPGLFSALSIQVALGGTVSKIKSGRITRTGRQGMAKHQHRAPFPQGLPGVGFIRDGRLHGQYQ
jgi:hypothetical protein